MFGKNLLRALRSSVHGRGFNLQQQQGRGARGSHVVAAGAAGALMQAIARSQGLRFGTGVLCGGSAAVAWNQSQDGKAEEDFASETSHLEWVQSIVAQPGTQEVVFPGKMLREHPVGRLITEEDHLFEAMVQSRQIKEFRCFYNNERKVFYSVVKLGREVCGYPATVHGGLTAALIDESLGGLYTCMLTSGSLGVRLPALTARLEVGAPVPAAAAACGCLPLPAAACRRCLLLPAACCCLPLLRSLKRRRLGPSNRARTAPLSPQPATPRATQVDYKKKIPAGSIILVQVELDSVEKRKVWMRAEVTDGAGRFRYAAARSLFVTPRPMHLLRNMLLGWVPGMSGRQRQKQLQLEPQMASA
jgi:hypothetical protein